MNQYKLNKAIRETQAFKDWKDKLTKLKQDGKQSRVGTRKTNN